MWGWRGNRSARARGRVGPAYLWLEICWKVERVSSLATEAAAGDYRAHRALGRGDAESSGAGLAARLSCPPDQPTFPSFNLHLNTSFVTRARQTASEINHVPLNPARPDRWSLHPAQLGRSRPRPARFNLEPPPPRPTKAPTSRSNRIDSPHQVSHSRVNGRQWQLVNNPTGERATSPNARPTASASVLLGTGCSEAREGPGSGAASPNTVR